MDNFTSRGFAANPIYSNQGSQQDTMCQYDIGFEQPNSSTVMRNRSTMNNRASTD
ncbi:unnamed protein product, partial [Rotaria magnacalcarata]